MISHRQSRSLILIFSAACASTAFAERPNIEWMIGGHRLTVRSVGFSPDGTLAFSAGDDSTVKVWRVSDGALLHTFIDNHFGNSARESAAISPDGLSLSSTGTGGAARWPLNDPLTRVDYTCVETGYAVAFSPDQSILGIGGTATGSEETICLFDYATASQIRTFGSSNQNYVFTLFFHPDGQTVVAGSGGIFQPNNPGFIRYWRMSDGVEVHTLSDQGGRVNQLALSPDGANFASAGGNGTLKIRRLSDGIVQTPLVGHTGEVRSVAYSPDGQFLASTGQDASIRVWQASNGQQIRLINTGSSFMQHSVAWAPDGVHLLSGGVDRAVSLWNSQTGAAVREFTQFRNIVTGLAVSSDGSLVVTGDQDKRVITRRAIDGAVLRSFLTSNFIANLAISPDSQLIATTHGSDTTVRVWNANNGSLAFNLVGHVQNVGAVAFSPDGQWIATGCAATEGSTRLWRASDGQFVRTFVEPGMGTNTIAFSRDSQTLATGGDSTVRLWKVSDGSLIRRLQGHTSGVASLDFSRDGATIVSGSHDRTARLWRVSDGALLHTFSGGETSVTSVAFSPDGTTLATGSNFYDLTLRLWRVSDGASLAVYNEETGTGAFAVEFVPHSSRYAFLRGDACLVMASNPFAPLIPGDVDGDGLVDDFDLTAFVNVLLGTSLSSDHIARADQNHDGNADGLDITPFVAAMMGS
jgi:WD40 repeat protein